MMETQNTTYFQPDAEPFHLGGRQAWTPYVLSDHLAPKPFAPPTTLDRYLTQSEAPIWAAPRYNLFDSMARPHAEASNPHYSEALARNDSLTHGYSLVSEAISKVSDNPWGEVHCVRYDDAHWAHFGVVSSRTACEVGVIEAAQQELYSRMQAGAAGERIYPSSAEVGRLYVRVRQAYTVLRAFHLAVAMINIETWNIAARRGLAPVAGPSPWEMGLAVGAPSSLTAGNLAVLQACSTMNQALKSQTTQPQRLWDTWWRRTDERFERFWQGHAAAMKLLMEGPEPEIISDFVNSELEHEPRDC